ncbi:MAG: hypothetical protein LWX52_17085, partial [Deltaproteobacteria bacterium]|nr:hypothetical protein [Deltaproteobacteria bacterium]
AIYASLTSIESIIGAHVWAEVAPPSDPPVTILLSDNGQGADRFQLDGVYSGFFTQYAGNGRYSVRVFADNVDYTAELGAQFKDGPGIQSDNNSAMALPYDMLTSDESGMVAREMTNPDAKLGYNFERVTSVGAFELSGYEAGDNIGPCKVITLSVTNTGQDPPAIVLGWIAPGDDMDNGSATSYDLRYSKSPIDEANFDSANQVEGMDPPKAAGEEEQYTILDLDCNTEYYFAIKAIDEAGNKSEMSNVISGQIDDVTPPTIDSLSANRTVLWPPNHKMVDIGFSLEVIDNCDQDPQVTIEVTSDEPTATAPGAGGSQYAPDAEITDDTSILLRAERSGEGDGRVYRIAVTATDASGNTSSDTVSVKVNHDKKTEAIDSGQNYDATEIN